MRKPRDPIYLERPAGRRSHRDRVGVLLFSIPLISGSLGLSQASSLDARVKTDVMHRDYCGLALQEYIKYPLMDTTRWVNFLADNLDPDDPTKVTAIVDVCDEDITLTVTQQDPDPDQVLVANPLPTIPDSPAYQQRDFQTYKTVSDSDTQAGKPVTYTITVINRSDKPTTLREIHDTLPAGFSYDCTDPPDQLTLPGMPPQDIIPSPIPCPSGSAIQWGLPPSTPKIEPGEEVTLVFTANTSPVHGTYCNETYVKPGSLKTRSGKTAIVQVGPFAGLCPGQAVVVSQTMDNADLVSVDLSTIPYTYNLEVGYTMKVENIGTEDLELSGFIDLLPVGFSYFTTIPGGDITDAPFNLHHVSKLDRQRVTWKFNPNIPMAPGTSQTLKFKAVAIVGQGVYWVDLLVDFDKSFPEKGYTWPTAIVSVKDVYDVTAADADGNVILIDLQVQVQDPEGLIARWNIN